MKVKHLIILGHTDCGGIKAAYKLHLNSLNKKYNFINKWLELFIMSYDNIDKKNPKKKQLEQLEKETIKTSIKNLFSYNFIKTAVRIKKLSIHGLIHNIGTGQLQFLNPATKDFEKL